MLLVNSKDTQLEATNLINYTSLTKSQDIERLLVYFIYIKHDNNNKSEAPKSDGRTDKH